MSVKNITATGESSIRMCGSRVLGSKALIVTDSYKFAAYIATVSGLAAQGYTRLYEKSRIE